MRIPPDSPKPSPSSRAAPGSGLPSARELLDAILRDVNRQRTAMGLSTFQMPDDAKATNDSDGNDWVDLLESRISSARLTAGQKDMIRRFAAVSIKGAQREGDLPKVGKSVLAIVQAWESANRGQELLREGPQRVKRLADYLEELTASERAAGQLAALHEQARGAEPARGADQAAKAAPRPTPSANAAQPSAAQPSTAQGTDATPRVGSNDATARVGSVVDVVA